MLRTRLFDVLDARGIRYYWFARQIGLHPTALSHVKAGKRGFPDRCVARACEVLQMPADLLFVAQEVAHTTGSVTSLKGGEATQTDHALTGAGRSSGKARDLS